MVELQLEPPQDHLIRRIDDPIYPCRVYEYENRIYPSVTSVLSASDESGWYEKWVEKVGQTKADAITRIAAARGSLLHLACQEFVCRGSIPKTLLMPDDLYRFSLVKKELAKLGKIRGVEHRLVCKEYQVAGTTDLIAYHDKVLTLFDYKSSNKPKQEEGFRSFWLQAAFYAIAWNEEHPQEPIEKLGIIPINDEEPFCKPRFVPLSGIQTKDLHRVREDFRLKFSM